MADLKGGTEPEERPISMLPLHSQTHPLWAMLPQHSQIHPWLPSISNYFMHIRQKDQGKAYVSFGVDK
ncbi:unnamed protein product [Sphenostylis stenocarpa]|uniref:Uncharacterized protein n=1 Tax=Sphenostylis stenocarpa TaxID=92480 RepID=A0AA86SND9_9FABA|nr:unnamed protein product [Sphenostylis stenocarpa]